MLDARKYKAILVHRVFPVLDATYGKNGYLWTQDGAPCHTAKIVLKYLESRLGSRGFWSKGIWPSNSCNLNPLDYSLWTYVESKACSVNHSSVASMKSAVEEEWNNMPRSYVKTTCARFRRRVEAMVAAKGGVFEKE